MHFAIAISVLLSLASAAAVPADPFKRQSEVCGPLQTPLCCQLDGSGVVNLSCENAGKVKNTDEFYAVCAESGRTAECCVLPIGSDGLACTAA